MSASWREASSGMLTLTNVGEPPPPYTAEVEDHGQQGQLTSVSWEPPPMYDVAIVPKPYEVSFEERWKSVAHTGFPMGGVPTLKNTPSFAKISENLHEIKESLMVVGSTALCSPPRRGICNNDCKYFG